jgi:hypothetical protein
MGFMKEDNPMNTQMPLIGESEVVSHTGTIHLTGPNAVKSIAASIRTPTYCGFHIRQGTEAENKRHCQFCLTEREIIRKRLP